MLKLKHPKIKYQVNYQLGTIILYNSRCDIIIINHFGFFYFSPKPTAAVPTVDDEAVQRAVEEVAAAVAVAHQETEPKMQHAMAHDLGHGEAVSKLLHNIIKLILYKSFVQSFSVRRELYGPSSREGRNVYFTLAFAGIALMAAVFVGVAVAKWRTARSPHSQGFIEVDQVKICVHKKPNPLY